MSLDHQLYEKFELRRLTTEDYEPDVKNFVKEFYTKQDVLAQITGATKEDERGIYEYRAHEALKYNASYAFFEKSSNKLVALKLNLLHGTKDSTVTSMLVDNPNVNLSDMARKVIRFVDWFVGDIYTELGAKLYMEMGMTCVHKDYANRGLGSELGRQSEILAKKIGCDYLMSFATSSYTQKSNEKSGFVLLREVLYSDYADLLTNEKLFHITLPQHTHGKIYYKRI